MEKGGGGHIHRQTDRQTEREGGEMEGEEERERGGGREGAWGRGGGEETAERMSESEKEKWGKGELDRSGQNKCKRVIIKWLAMEQLHNRIPTD